MLWSRGGARLRRWRGFEGGGWGCDGRAGRRRGRARAGNRARLGARSGTGRCGDWGSLSRLKRGDGGNILLALGGNSYELLTTVAEANGMLLVLGHAFGRGQNDLRKSEGEEIRGAFCDSNRNFPASAVTSSIELVVVAAGFRRIRRRCCRERPACSSRCRAVCRPGSRSGRRASDASPPCKRNRQRYSSPAGVPQQQTVTIS